KVDIEEPDLYIPVMSFTTYILVYGVQRGIMSDFKPEVLSSSFSFALTLLVLEVALAKGGFYLAGCGISILDITGNCSCKYVHTVLMVLIRILIGDSNVYYIFFCYLAACAGFATFRFMMRQDPNGTQAQYGMQPSNLHKHFAIGIAVAQLPLCWLLTPSAASKAIAAAA
ncbi:unnamed protein product, partial [Prorocentrum cordatum]